MIKPSYVGYIEGYFGKQLTWQQRSNIIDCLHTLRMNTYLYAPKEDPLHRLQWRIPYPATWRNSFIRLNKRALRLGIRIVTGIAPGLSYDYCSNEDYTTLLAKCKNFLSCGITDIALLMDDIDSALPEKCKKSFSSLGQAHGKLLVRLFVDLQAACPDIQLWFCPTIYTDSFAEGNGADSDYIKDLSKAMPSEVIVLWTGPQVISEELSSDTLSAIAKRFSNLVIWDNYYAIDYSPYRLFIGSYEGRNPEILKMVTGLMINPTGLFHTDIFLLSLFSDFLENGKITDANWEKTAKKHNIPGIFFPIRDFFWSPFKAFPESMITPQKLHQLWSLHLYDELIVKWQHPLKMEWYPFLQGFYRNLVYLQKKSKKQLDLKWIYMNYPPIIADRMVEP